MVIYSIDREETQTRRGEDFHHVGEPSAVEFWPYRQRLLEIEPVLRIGDLITVKIAEKLGIKYWLIGNNNLKAEHLHYKKLDNKPLGVVSSPGKSVHINFMDEVNGNMDQVCKAMLVRCKKRQDRLYEASVEVLFRKGFYGFWAPTHSSPLHVRLVHKSHLEDPGKKLDEGVFRDLIRAFRQIAK